MPTPRGKISRDPERTQRRILAAALHEFAKRGFAGARVDTIARRAGSNKRMLYHYFEDKRGLLRAVLRHKIAERTSRTMAQSQSSDSEIVLWFKRNCDDTDWVRLLAWESLENKKDNVVDEENRRKYYARWMADRIRQQQASGQLRADVPAKYLQMVQLALAIYPLAMPQITRLVTGYSPQNPKFQREYAQFLETIISGFRPLNRKSK